MKLVKELSREEVFKEVSSSFVIEVQGHHFTGKREQFATNPKRLIEILDEGMRSKKANHAKVVERFCRQALESPEQVFTRTMRRGITIKFYSK